MTHTIPGSLRARRFPIGQLVATRGAIALLEEHGEDYKNLIDRHTTGDWGSLDAEDVAQNEAGIRRGNRLLSSYPVGEHRVWVITEADRSTTTILLPDEY